MSTLIQKSRCWEWRCVVLSRVLDPWWWQTNTVVNLVAGAGLSTCQQCQQQHSHSFHREIAQFSPLLPAAGSLMSAWAHHTVEIKHTHKDCLLNEGFLFYVSVHSLWEKPTSTIKFGQNLVKLPKEILCNIIQPPNVLLCSCSYKIVKTSGLHHKNILIMHGFQEE